MMLLTKRLYEDTNFSGPWNFGPDSLAAKTVKELVEKFIYYYGKGNYEIQKSQSFKESSYLQIDVSRAKRDLNWKPRFDFDKTVKKPLSGTRFF